MKTKLSIALVAVAAVAAVATALLASHGSSVRAQPAANIARPSFAVGEDTWPGDTKGLYPGCNNIALTFPGGTASATVMQAVTPAGAVESMWRYNPAERNWDGHSPAFPEVGSLLTVDFLDAVWLCIPGAPPAGPTATPPAGLTATPPAGPTATSPAGPTATPGPPTSTATPTGPGPTPTTVQGGTGVPPTEALESFAYALKMEFSMEGDGEFVVLFVTEGEFEAPDRMTCTTTVSLLDFTDVISRLVVIGGDAWIDMDGGFRAARADDPEVVAIIGGCPGSPTYWEDSDLGALGSLQGQPETVNGVAAIRYSVSELPELADLLGLLPPELEGMAIDAFDIWLAEDGRWLVRLNADVSLQAEDGEELRVPVSLDITDPNSTDIHVVPPI